VDKRSKTEKKKRTREKIGARKKQSIKEKKKEGIEDGFFRSQSWKKESNEFQ